MAVVIDVKTPVRRKSLILVVLISFLARAALLAYHVYVQRLQAEQSKRDAVYRAVLAQYQRDLRVGMARADVTAYLDSHNIRYGDALIRGSGNAWSYEVRIGTDLSHRMDCANWEVYVALDF